MKNFNAFKESLTQEIVNQWGEEVYDELTPKFESIRERDPNKYFIAYPQSFAMKISMRMLEAYHNWLHQ